MSRRAYALRIVVHLLLCGAIVGLWHVLLLKLFLDRPAVVAAWLLAIAVLVLLARRLAIETPAGDRALIDRVCAALDGPGIAFVAFFLCLVFVFHWGYERAASDGREYFVQVRSLVIDHDLDFRNENQAFGVRGTADVYAFGAPLLWTPFFVLCHAWLGLLNLFGGHVVRDGFANPYQRAIGFGSLVYGFVGLVLIYRVLTDYFSKVIAFSSTLVLCCGSFVIWYLTIENSMVHGPSMFATTLFLYWWHRTREHRTTAQWAVLGAAAGLMSIVRWQDSLFLILPVGMSVGRQGWEAIRQRVTSTSTERPLIALTRDLAAFGGALVVVASPQLVFWKVVRGAWISPPTEEHGVHLSSLHVGDVLFSPNHGLLSWTPVLYLAVLGLPLFFRRDRAFFLVLIAGLLAQVYVNSAVEIWWGGGFGGRRFANSALVFGVGLASLLDLMRRRPFVAPSLIFGALIVTNATFMLDVDAGRLPLGEGIEFPQIVASVYSRFGNPFSFPMNALVARIYDAPWRLYDQQRGRTYNNLTIDLGEPEDETFLGSGWSEPERNAEFSFRWTSGAESVVVVPLNASGDYRLDLRCAPFAYTGALDQRVTVAVNGTTIAQLSMHAAMDSYGVEVPARVIRADRNQIRFQYRYAVSPADVGVSTDSRLLAMMCDRITLTRLTGTR
jgi:hypothetical protein